MSAYACCVGGGYKNIDNINCDSQYWYENWSKGACDTKLSDYCSQDNNIFDKPVCTRWISAFKEKGNELIDQIITSKCMEPINKNRPECACIVAAYDVSRQINAPTGLRVDCVYNQCINNPLAYRTSNMLSVPCPEVVDCSINISDAKFVIDNKSKFSQNFVQQCGSKIYGTSPETKENHKKEIIIAISVSFAGFLILALLIVIGYFILRKKSE
jgi:hypothetical protein